MRGKVAKEVNSFFANEPNQLRDAVTKQPMSRRAFKKKWHELSDAEREATLRRMREANAKTAAEARAKKATGG